MSFKRLPYQLSMVGYAPTMVVTGDGESGFDFYINVSFIQHSCVIQNIYMSHSAGYSEV